MNVLAVVLDQIERNKEGFILRLTRNSERQLAVPDQEIGCLLWTARCNNDGYPRMNFVFESRHVTAYVHHVTFALHTGRNVPPKRERDHSCNTRHCIEPRHLEVVTHAENIRRKHDRRAARPFKYEDAISMMMMEAA